MVVFLFEAELLLDRLDGAALQLVTAAVHWDDGSATIEHHPKMAALCGLECRSEFFKPPFEFRARH
jgi:hypothetical protein